MDEFLRRGASGLVAVLVLAAGCKSGSDAGADKRCRDWCSEKDQGIRRVQGDLDNADLAAQQITKIEVKTDADIRPANLRAAALCGDARASVAHAHGIVWALAQREKDVTGFTGGLSDAEQSLAFGDKAWPCDGSPAQMNGTFVNTVHTAKASAVKTVDVAACQSSCMKAP